MHVALDNLVGATKDFCQRIILAAKHDRSFLRGKESSHRILGILLPQMIGLRYGVLRLSDVDHTQFSLDASPNAAEFARASRHRGTGEYAPAFSPDTLFLNLF